VRKNVGSGSPWESAVGYSRAVCVGNIVSVAGTTAPGDGAYEQARNAFATIGRALNEAGASFDDVVRTRMFVTDIAFFDEVGRAHAEVFADVKPAATMIAVVALAAPDLLVEIEADAVVAL
jgi:enamine deaminase RidA (YjgF/YER057c/UK114 family)